MCRTGYVNIRDVNRELFGAEVIDKTSEVWGLDEEGEVKGIFRPSGYPHVRPTLLSSLCTEYLILLTQFWYASGDFFNSRFESKHLVSHTARRLNACTHIRVRRCISRR